MKLFKQKLLAGVLIISLFLSSCKKDFLDTFPTDAVAATEATANIENGYAALNGIHRSLYAQYDQQGQSGEGSNNIFRDLMGEDIVYPRLTGSTGLIGFLQWDTHRNLGASDLRYVYRFYYRIISNANVLISGIDNADGPEADKKIIKGQALAYRAWAHFQLVQLWGKRYDGAIQNSQPGVPLLTSNELEGQPRSTVEEVYTQINTDLGEAAALLAGYARSGTAAKSNLNLNVVQGIRARVALVQQDWETAAINAIAARAGHLLMDTTAYKSGFNNIENEEWIWGSRQIDEQSTNLSSYFAYISANFNSTPIRTQPRAINSTLYNAIPDTDIRKRMWDPTGATVPIPPGGVRVNYQNKKFLAKSDVLSVGDVPYMRSAEMYLIEAEARAHQGQDASAQTALFELAKNRDHDYVSSANTGQALIDEILFQRRIELWGEGFRFTDLKRTNAPLNRAGIPNHQPLLIGVTNIPAGDDRWEWLFPQDEVNANKQIVQNP